MKEQLQRGLTIPLVQAHFKQRTRILYAQAFRRWCLWLVWARQVGPGDQHILALLAGKYIQFFFTYGYPNPFASYTICALQTFSPWLRSILPFAWAHANGLQELAPPKGDSPLREKCVLPLLIVVFCITPLLLPWPYKWCGMIG